MRECRARIVDAIRRFFTEPGSPYDLAFFRIFFFAFALASTNVSVGLDEHLAGLPHYLTVPPTGMRLLLSDVPRSPGLVRVAFVIAVLSSITSVIGLWTRWSALAFLLSAGYVLTLPWLFGAAGHYHDVLWVAAILAASPCNDVLSVDAARAAARRVPQGEPVHAPPASLAYSLPLRAIWLLLGLIYFFPGLYKLLHEGLGFASPTNMRSLILTKIPQYPGWLPPFHVWRHGWLLVAMGLGTMLFELSFVFLVIGRRTRVVAAACGLLFHNLTNWIMRIPFWAVQILYLSFVPWQRLCESFFARRGSLVCVYDADRRDHLRTASILQVTGLPTAVTFLDASDTDALTSLEVERRLPHVSRGQFCVVDGVRVFEGYDAYRRLAWRVPWTWPALALLYLPPVANRARSKRLARERATVPDQSTGTIVTTGGGTGSAFGTAHVGLAPVLVSAVVIAAMLWCGATGVRAGWPFSMYPAFDRRATAIQPYSEIHLETIGVRGEKREVDVAERLSWMPVGRREVFLARFTQLILRHPDRRDMIRSLWRTLGRQPGDRTITRINAYRVLVSTVPPHAGRPLSRRALFSRACVSCSPS